MAYKFSLISVLLGYHSEIAISQLSKFQARLKNLHRLGWPLNFQSSKGKASLYSAGDFLDMAMAMELLQLGLTPERAIEVLSKNRWKSLMAYRMAASQLLRGFEAAPESIYIFFDPWALNELSKADPADKWDMRGQEPKNDLVEASFFFGGSEMMAKLMEGWGVGTTRIAVCNVSALIRVIQINPDVDMETDRSWTTDFWKSIEEWADAQLAAMDTGLDLEGDYLLNVLDRFIFRTPSDLAKMTRLPVDRVKMALSRWDKERSDGQHP